MYIPKNHYQSYQSGIETSVIASSCQLKSSINRTKVELKLVFCCFSLICLVYQSYQSGIETLPEYLRRFE